VAGIPLWTFAGPILGVIFVNLVIFVVVLRIVLKVRCHEAIDSGALSG
jgi:hypothetical protein